MRREPPFLAVALGIFNNSAYTDASDINATMPSTEINYNRVWRTSRILPFLGHIGLELLNCQNATSNATSSFVRVTTNSAPIPLPNCQSGPGASCPAAEFEAYVQERGRMFGGAGAFATQCRLDATEVANAGTVGGQDGLLEIYDGVLPPLTEED